MSKASAERNINNLELQVKEAFKEDQGRGVIRIDPDIFKNFKFKNGDILQIIHPKNEKNSAGILFPSKSKDKGTNFIRLGSFLKRNLRAKLGDKVRISKISPTYAEYVLFGTSEINIVSNYLHVLAKRFQNRVFYVGDIVSFYYYGRRIDLQVLEFIPKSEVARLDENTEIFCQ